jgi:predicted flap endonuclease-1-like 5' DNA nuclease
LRWQQDMIEQQETNGADEKMLVVLNQQLAASRADNQRLLDQISELREQASGAPVSGEDDLSRIRGVGPKLVNQLNELGITRYSQIAALAEDDLEDENHALYNFRGRIVKDEWISQATDLMKLS